MSHDQSAITCRRARTLFAAVRKRRMAARLAAGFASSQLLSLNAISAFANLPLRARINDRLAVAMIAIDEAIQICELEGNTAWLASSLSVEIVAAYDQVNCIMKTISD
jgi:hypothetical protein